MRTLQTENLPLDPQTHPVGAPAPIPDLTGRIVAGIESLQLRIRNLLRFRRGDWFINRDAGIPYGELLQHPNNLRLLEQAITNALRGVAEVTGVVNVRTDYTAAARTYAYSATVQSIYGDLQLDEEVG